MKPFNLEEAKAGEPLITREGESVKFICVEPDAHEDTRLLVLRNGRVLPLYIDGTYNGPQAKFTSSGDVFMAPKKRTLWCNVYRGSASHYDSEEEANNHGLPSRLGGKAWPLEIEE